MTFVRGDTFEERLRGDAPVPTDQVLRVVREIADALGYAHRRGIVHRDVKPSNILLDEDSGRALLGRFRDCPRGRRRGVITHTARRRDRHARYMAPEQAASGRVDGRADLHSLAAVAFRSAGRRIVAVQRGSAALGRAVARRSARPVDSSRHRRSRPRWRSKPDDRPATAAAWLAALGRAEVRPWRPWAAAGVAW